MTLISKTRSTPPPQCPAGKGKDDASMIATSSLSPLTRTPTPASNESFSRYQTASEGTAGTVTEPSTPGEAARDRAGKAPYRDALDLPHELKGRCKIHLEEQYCEHD
jgi:hypothetical protein